MTRHPADHTNASEAERILAVWRRFVAGLSPGDEIRPVVLESSTESLDARAEPGSQSLSPRRVPERELERRLAESGELLGSTVRHLERVSAALGEVPHAVYLVDRGGVVLHSLGNLSSMAAFGLLPGYERSQSAAGMSAAGTALRTGRPTTVVGGERPQPCTCTAAPIRGPDGTLAGAVDIDTTAADGGPELLLLVSYVARSIEAELRRRTSRSAERVRAEAAEHPVNGGSRGGLAQVLWLENRRLGRELHDSVLQEIIGLGMMARGVERRLAARSVPESESIGRIARDLQDLAGRVRDFARGLYPVDVDDRGLCSALEELLARTEERHDIVCRLDCERDLEVADNDLAIHLFRIAQEVISNAVKHARPRRIDVRLEKLDPRSLVLEIRDDGVGFAPEEVGRQGMGLKILRHRVRLIGASMQFRKGSSAGTVFTCATK